MAFIQEIIPAVIEDMWYPVIESEIYALVQSSSTQLPSECLEVEWHRKIFNVHFILDGSEQVGWVAKDRLVACSQYY